MWSALLSGLAWLLSKLFGKPAGPSQEAVAAASAAQANQAAKTDAVAVLREASVAQAEANAPSDKAAVIDELNKGTF